MFTKCDDLVYVGETEYMYAHFQNHKTSVNKNHHNQLVAKHFNENEHSLKNIKIIGIQK